MSSVISKKHAVAVGLQQSNNAQGKDATSSGEAALWLENSKDGGIFLRYCDTTGIYCHTFIHIHLHLADV